MIVALAGGVGAARMLSGLAQVVDPRNITAIVNTGDDLVLHGLYVCPDLDTCTYTLAGAISTERGWGLDGETWRVMESLGRYRGSAGGWFALGDKDLGTHLYRTQRLGDGATLTEVTAEITEAWGLDLRLLPMTDDAVRTRVTIAGEGEVGFQEYFVERRHAVPITAVRFDGAATAAPGPAVLEAIATADRIVVCPSNPLVSIGPILAIRGVRTALEARRDATVAVSPIIAGATVKGPADRMLAELGHEPTVVGIARMYAPLARTLVIDEADARRASEVAAEGIAAEVAPTLMTGPAESAALAKVVLDV